MRIILASASPRRKELLAQIGLDFEIIVSNVEEKVTTTIPCEVVEELSGQKAEGVLAQMLQGVHQTGQSAAATKTGPDLKMSPEPETAADEQAYDSQPMMIIGSDTIVACDGQILGKPKDAEDAKSMLRKLQGRSHEVYTGVTVLYMSEGVNAPAFGQASLSDTTISHKVVRRTFHEATKVHFFPMSEEEIDAYVATGDPLDKAGAYGIQGLCARYISGIEGDYNNVVGLPVGRLYQVIKDLIN